MLEENLKLRSEYRKKAHRLWIDNEPEKAWDVAYNIKKKILLVENNNSKKFYKYKSFSDWKEGRFFSEIKDIENNQICLMDPSKFNDPYDCLIPPEVCSKLNKTSVNDPIIKIKAKSVIRDTQKNNYLASISFNEKGRKKEITNWLVENRKNLDEKKLEDLAKDIRSNLAISCLSISPFEMYFWVHYGGCHKGYCVEYEVSEDTFNSYLHPVEYVDEWPIQSFKTKLGGSHASFALIKSNKDWSAEHEWRFLMSKEPEQMLSKTNSGLKISAIYLGLDFFNNEANKKWQKKLLYQNINL